MKRTLVLRREQLADLTAGDLAAVAGGARTQMDCPDNTYYCITGWGMCRSALICS